MSFSPPNYTDGVPVKISERFKPPPEIHLPSKLKNALSRTQLPVAFQDDYNFDLERKILSKTSEWINWRSNEKSERQQRIYQRDLERQKRWEVEQKEKLNQVSYPSADELSDDEDDIEDTNEAINNIPAVAETNPFNPNFSSNTILMPTQAIVSTTSSNNRKSHRRYASNSSNKIDFSFFESDASPFDHLEMKSLNEMEVLAQVLKSTAVESDENALERNNSSESENSETTRGGSGGVGNNNNNNNEQPALVTQPQDIPSHHQLQSYQQQQQQVYSNYYNNYAGGNNSQQQFFNNANYSPSPNTTSSATHQLHHHLNHNHNLQQYSTNTVPSLFPFSSQSTNAYYTSPQQNNYAVNYVGGINNNITASTTTTATMACENSSSDKMENSSKSKSVPDMVKELNEELDNSQRRRIRNYSQNSHKDDITTEEAAAAVTVVEAKCSELLKLPLKSQAFAKQICQMGFKEDMVVRVLMRIGENDKKIVEHLIILSEFLQMGFAEEKISEALIKFDNNKDQALDFLIS